MRKSRSGKRLEAPEETLARMADWMRGEGYADRTLKCYLFDLGHFARWLAMKGVRALRDLAPPIITEYQAVLAAKPGRGGRPLAAETRAHVISAILALGKFMERTGRVKESPARGLTHPRVPRKLPDNVLSIREMERLLSVPRLDGPVELRNRALMELLYATGLRQTEALDLRLEEVDLHENEVRVVRGKGGKGRIVPILRETAAVLSAYLSEARPELARDGDSGLFFLSLRGKRVDPSRMLKTFKRYARAAGIARPVGFHTFRHSCATHLLQKRAGLRHIQELLGHNSLTSTQIYTRVTITDLKAAHARFHPREGMEV